MRWSNDSSEIALALDGQSTRIVDVDARGKLSLKRQELRNRSPLRFDWSPNGSRIVATQGSEILMIDPRTLVDDHISISSNGYNQLRVASDGSYPDANGQVSLFNRLTAATEVWSRDDKFYAMADHGVFQLRDNRTGITREIDLDGASGVRQVAISPNGQCFGALEELHDKLRIRIWNSSDVNEPILSLNATESVFAISMVSESEVYLLSAGVVTKYGLPSGKQVWRRDVLELQNHHPYAINQSEEIAYLGDKFRLFDLKNDKAVSSFGYGATQLAWTPDNRIVMLAGDNTIRLLNPRKQSRSIIAAEPAFAFAGPQYGHLLKNGQAAAWHVVSNDLRVCDTQTGKLKTVVYLDAGWFECVPSGHMRSSPDLGAELLYIATMSNGEQRQYTTTQFKERFGWKNDPSEVWTFPNATEQ